MKKKKVLYIINMVATVAVFLLAVFIIITGVIARMNDKVPSVFGYSIHIVLTDSMSPEIDPGDFVLAKTSDISKVEKGDYVIFYSPDPMYEGMIIIHEAVEIRELNGTTQITTKGTNNPTTDTYPVKEIIAIYRWHSPFLGKVLSFFADIRNVGLLAIVLLSVFVIVKYARKIYHSLRKKQAATTENGEIDINTYTVEELQEMVNRLHAQGDTAAENSEINAAPPVDTDSNG